MKNVGNVDKIVRIALAVLSVVLGIVFINILWLAIVLFAFAAIMVFTSVFGVCPIYKLFGVNTCKVE